MSHEYWTRFNKKKTKTKGYLFVKEPIHVILIKEKPSRNETKQDDNKKKTKTKRILQGHDGIALPSIKVILNDFVFAFPGKNC